MAKLEKQILALISQLNRAALLRVMQAIVEKLQSDESEITVSSEQWERMDQSVIDFEEGKLDTISRGELEEKLKTLRKK